MKTKNKFEPFRPFRPFMTVRPVEYGTVIFGQVNGHPPAHWEFTGWINGAARLEHVKPGSWGTAFGMQFVSAETLRNLSAGE